VADLYVGLPSKSNQTNKLTVENMWVQSRLVEGSLAALAEHRCTAPLARPRYCLHELVHNTIRCSYPALSLSYSVIHSSHTTRGTLF
jgi:hypothetical protein